MLNKRLIVLLGVATLTLGIGKVIAACGNSSCGMVGDDFRCTAEFPDGTLRDCSTEQPCEMDCP